MILTIFKKYLFFCFCFFSFIISSAQVTTDYIQLKGLQFTLNKQPYFFSGINYWYGSLLAHGLYKEAGKIRLQKELDFLQQQGITNLRIVAAVEGSGNITGVPRISPSFQTDAGEFDTSFLEGLDFLLLEMGKRNMKAVLFLSNNWEWSGGFLQYLQWEGHIPDSSYSRKLNWDDMRDYTSKFYTCNECIANYREQVWHIINHINKETGIKYIDDPTIMSWELANEPRPMRSEASRAYFLWIKETAKFIKTIDSNHLVCIGHEGIVGTAFDTSLYKEIHAIPDIDYLTIHIWPKNWGWIDGQQMEKGFLSMMDKVEEYLQTHLKFANELRKPLVLEEFGLPRDGHQFVPIATTLYRDRLLQMVVKYFLDSRTHAGAFAGFNIWAFAGQGRPIPNQLFWKMGDDYLGDPPMEEQGLYSIFDSDESTWLYIRKCKL